MIINHAGGSGAIVAEMMLRYNYFYFTKACVVKQNYLIYFHFL